MDETSHATIESRIAAGAVTAVLGCRPGSVTVTPKPGLEVIRVECDALGATLGLLPRASRQIEAYLAAYLGEEELDAPLLQQLELARGRVVSGIRRRLLGDAAEARADARFVAACARLAEATDGHAVLVFEGVDAADRGSLARLGVLLAETAATERGFVVPLVLGFRARAPKDIAGELLDVVRRVGGEGAVVMLPAREEAAPDLDTPGRWPEQVAWVLRCVAVVGPAIEISFLAQLLELDKFEVLRVLQRGVELGCQLVDDGRGRVVMDARAAAALQVTTLPSLRAAWHRRAAALLSDDDSSSAQAEAEPDEPLTASTSAPGADSAPVDSAAAAGEGGEEGSSEDDAEERGEEREEAGVEGRAEGRAEERAEERAGQQGESPLRFAEMFVPGAIEWTEPMDAEREPVTDGAGPAPVEPGAAGARRGGASRRHRRRRRGPEQPWIGSRSQRADSARAARHLAAAGELAPAAKRYLEAAREAVEHGDYARAAEHARAASTVVAAMRKSEERRLLELRVNTEFARLQWRASGPDAAFTLAGALETIERARALLRPSDPVAAHVELGELAAGVCYDLGDIPSLQRALAELTEASRTLTQAGEHRAAAGLLNDQAAVYIRLGDPVRAIHLLNSSRQVFEAAELREPDDELTRHELAETHHLLARLPLHARLKPGREGDAFSMAIDHALIAEQYYTALDHRRELGRVWETFGRLELRKGRVTKAAEHLERALSLQREIGDAIGIARSSAALADYLLAAGRPGDALQALASSIAFNVEKGSPIGLAFNRRALSGLRDAVAPTGARPPSAGLAALYKRALEQLEAGERSYGRVHLAGESDD